MPDPTRPHNLHRKWSAPSRALLTLAVGPVATATPAQAVDYDLYHHRDDFATRLCHWPQRHSRHVAPIARRMFVLAISAVAYLALTSSPATAAEAHVDTRGPALTVRSGPSVGARPVGALRDGTPVRIVCQTRGDTVTGKLGTSRLWDRLSTGGYASDAYVFTGSDRQVAPTCRTTSGAHAGQPAPAKHTRATSYTIRTSGSRVRLRDIPSTGGRVVGYADNGDSVRIVCTTSSGSNVPNGHSTSAVWDRTTNGAWISDVYVETGTSLPVAPECSRGFNQQERKERDGIDRAARQAATPPAPRIDGLLLPKQFNNPARVTEQFREGMEDWWSWGSEDYPLIKEAYGVLLSICDDNPDCYGRDREAYEQLDALYWANMGELGLYEDQGGPVPPSSPLGQQLKKWRQDHGLPEPPSPAAHPLPPGKDLQKWWGQPINNGFLHESVPTILKPGTRIDRYGHEGGLFVSPVGTAFPQRSLPAQAESRPYRAYEVTQPIPVAGGTIAPWFGQPGGGVQYLLPGSVGDLKAAGFLKDVN